MDLALLDNIGKIQNGGYLQNKENLGDGTYGGNSTHSQKGMRFTMVCKNRRKSSLRDLDFDESRSHQPTFSENKV